MKNAPGKNAPVRNRRDLLARNLFSLFFASFLPGCAGSRPGLGNSAAPLEHLVLVATADLHGALEGADEKIEGHLEQTIHRGGVDVLAGYVANIKAAHPGRVLLLDSGDEFQGTLVSNVTEGESVVMAFNALSYDAAAVGNHEFDFGPQGPDTVAGSNQDPLGALKVNIARAHYKVLAANIREKTSGRRPGWALPSTLVRMGAARIGIIGLITPTTPTVTNPLNVRTLDFTDPVPAAVAVAAELRARGADAVVVVAHMGGSCRNFDDPNDASSCDQESEAFRFARAIPPGTVDLFFGGHTHREVRHVVNGLPIAQALSSGRSFAVAELFVDTKAHRAVRQRTVLRPLVPLCREVYSGTGSCNPRLPPPGALALVPPVYEGKPVVPVAAIARLVAPYVARVAERRNQPLGIRTSKPFSRRNGESALADLLTDALREGVPGSDFAFLNSGGFRADLRAGDLKYGDLFEVIPFDNLVAQLRLTGAELREIIRLGTYGEHPFLKVSGLKVVVDRRKGVSPDQEVQVLRSDGTPLDDSALYTVVTSDFLVIGGDGLDKVIGRLPPERMTMLYDRGFLREVIIDALKVQAARGPLSPKRDDRLTVLRD